MPDSSEAGERFLRSLPRFPPRKPVAGVSSPAHSEGVKSGYYWVLFFSWLLLEGFLTSPLMKVGERSVFAGRSFPGFSSQRRGNPSSTLRWQDSPPRMLAGVCTPQTGRGSPRAPQQPKSPRGPCADTLKAPLPWESFQVTGGGEATPRSQTRLRGRGHGRRGECWHDGADEPGRTSLSPGGAAPSQGQRGGNTGWGTAAPLPPHPPVAVEILSCKICPGQDDS